MLILVFSLVIGADPAEGQESSTAEVRKWVEATRDALEPRQVRQGVVVEWSLTRTTTLTREKLDTRWRQVASLVDHPERATIEFHRKLLESPETVAAEAWYAGPESWMYQERRGDQDTLSAGGDGPIRWMLHQTGVQGQLTIIKSGVPFPAFFNVSRYLDLAREQIGLLAFGGLPGIHPASSLTVHSPSTNEWTAVFQGGAGDYRAVISRDPGAPGFVVNQLSWISNDTGVAKVVTRFERFVHTPEFEKSYPSVVRQRRSDDVLETYHLVALRHAAPGMVKERGQIPDVPAGVKRVDFRTSDQGVWANYPDASKVTWTSAPLHDQHVSTDAPSSPKVEPPTAVPGRFVWIAGSLGVLIVLCILVLTKLKRSTIP